MSVRGVPRILKSQATFVRVCWLIAVLASSALLLWQLSEVFVKYYSYPVSTSFEEGRDLPVFPDVTVCNLNPEAVDEESKMYTLSDYKRKFRSIIKTDDAKANLISTYYSWPNSDNETNDYILNDFQAALLTPSG